MTMPDIWTYPWQVLKRWFPHVHNELLWNNRGRSLLDHWNSISIQKYGWQHKHYTYILTPYLDELGPHLNRTICSGSPAHAILAEVTCWGDLYWVRQGPTSGCVFVWIVPVGDGTSKKDTTSSPKSWPYFLNGAKVQNPTHIYQWSQHPENTVLPTSWKYCSEWLQQVQPLENVCPPSWT